MPWPYQHREVLLRFIYTLIMSLELFLALHGALIVRIDENANVPVQNSSKYVFDLLTQMELNYGRHVFTAVLD